MKLFVPVTLGYMLLLVILAVGTPGLGLSGFLLDLIPADRRDQAHLPAYGLLAYLIMWGLRRSDWSLSASIATGLGVTCLFGLYTELLQSHVPGREASLADLLSDATGAVVASSLLLIQAWAMQPSSQPVPARRSGPARSRKGLWSR